MCLTPWQAFEELLAKYDKDNKGGLTYKVCRRVWQLGCCCSLGAANKPRMPQT
jgi:hypothetical protein